MHIKSTSMEGVFLMQSMKSSDIRGTFVKTFNEEEFAAAGLEYEFRESFYSSSAKGVIRGMHFQWPPHDHVKLVYCSHGAVIDVLVDLRTDSPTFKQYETFALNDQNGHSLYIPRGIAHGFLAMTDGATLVYLTTTVYHKDSDTGIRFDSFGYEWPVVNPIFSERDSEFVTLDELGSPF